MQEIITIAIADDHSIIHKALSSILTEEDGFRIVLTAHNGKELADQLARLPAADLPAIVLADIHMPICDGYATTCELSAHYPGIKVIALTVFDNEAAEAKMLQCGARGFLNKDSDADTIRKAIYIVAEEGYYHRETNNLSKRIVQLSDKESEFLSYCCKDLNYVEIAARMFRSINTIYTYRDILYRKLNLKTRAGLIVYALQSGLVLPQDMKEDEGYTGKSFSNRNSLQ